MTELDDLHTLCAQYREALSASDAAYDRWVAVVYSGPDADDRETKATWDLLWDRTTTTRTAITDWLEAHDLGDVLDVG